MSILIDKLVYPIDPQSGVVAQHKDGGWYVAKPCQLNDIPEIWRRLKDAWRVVVGRSFACHYKDDEEMSHE